MKSEKPWGVWFEDTFEGGEIMEYTEKGLMDCFVCGPHQMLVELDPEKETTDAGLLIPDSAKSLKRYRYGMVHKIGPVQRDTKGEEIPPIYEPGDRVYFPANAGHVVAMDQRVVSIMRSSEVICGWRGVESTVEPFSDMKPVKAENALPFREGDPAPRLTDPSGN